MLRVFLTIEFVQLVAIAAAGLSGFVEKHIWSPAYSYYMLLVLVVLDVLTNNLVEGKPLRPRNLALRILGYTVLMSFAHGFGEHEKGLFFIPQLVLAPFVLVHMRRLIISLGKLGWVDSGVADLLSKRITARAEAPEAPVPAPEATPEPTPEPEPAS
jgi:hypothetical protein